MCKYIQLMKTTSKTDLNRPGHVVYDAFNYRQTLF